MIANLEKYPSPIRNLCKDVLIFLRGLYRGLGENIEK
jgi:hypothetical protein